MNGVGGVVFRKAGPADRERAAGLLAKFPDDYIPQVWDEWVGLEPGGIYLAEVAGAVAALVCIQFVRPDEAYLAGMRVDPDLQGRGLGTEFARFQVEECRRLGARVGRLLTAHDNVRVHRMMATLGFHRVSDWIIGQREVRGDLDSTAGDRERDTVASGMETVLFPGEAGMSYLRARSAGVGLPAVISVPGDPWLVRGLRWAEEPPDACLAVGRAGEGVRAAALLEVGPDWRGRETLYVRWVLADGGWEGGLVSSLRREMRRRGLRRLGYSLPGAVEWFADWVRALPGDEEEGWDERFAVYELWLS